MILLTRWFKYFHLAIIIQEQNICLCSKIHFMFEMFVFICVFRKVFGSIFF